MDVLISHLARSTKFPRTIVHGGTDAKPDPKKVLDPEATAADCDAFLEVMGRMGARLGPLLLQFPLFLKDVFPSLQHFLGRLDGFMEKLPRDFRYAIETRNRDWLGPELLELCRRYRSGL